MSRESWNKREWRYDPETLASGWVEVLDEYDNPIVETGDIQVEFPWGNVPMQPNDDRGTALDENLDNHYTATYGYANYPGFLPDYEGDGDTGLETVVPDLVRKTISQAADLIEEAKLGLRANDHYLQINYLESIGTTVKVWCFDDNVYGGGYDQDYLIGLRPGDKLVIADDGGFLPWLSEVTVTSINEDGENSWFTFNAGQNLELDTSTYGWANAGSNLVDVITVMRGWNQPGDIKNQGTNIYCRYIGEW